MVWFKVDDGLATHPKTVLAGNAAMGLWVRAGAWSAQQLTEGVVPLYMVPTLGTKAQADRLVAAGLWVKHAKGYKFHQWDEDGRQPTRESVEAERAASRERQAKARQKAKESRNSHSVSHGVTSAAVTGGVTVPPSRPVPTRPDHLLTLSESSTETTASVDMTTIQNAVLRFCGRECSTVDAYRVVGTVLDRAQHAGTVIKHPAAYVIQAIQDNPDEFRELLEDAAARTLPGVCPHDRPLTVRCDICENEKAT